MTSTASPSDAAAHPAGTVEFFFDPVCPWAWITSRWVTEVGRQRDLPVEWRFISLRILNADKNYATDFPDGYIAGHGSGLKLLRVCAHVKRAAGADGNDRVAALYKQFGGDIHVHGRRREIVDHFDAGFPDYLRSVGLDEAAIAAANDESLDAELTASTEEALTRTGRGVGTPILSYHRGELTQSFFGPVMSQLPSRDDAGRIWDAMWTLATFPGFAELKRSLRDKPQLASSLDLDPA